MKTTKGTDWHDKCKVLQPVIPRAAKARLVRVNELSKLEESNSLHRPQYGKGNTKG